MILPTAAKPCRLALRAASPAPEVLQAAGLVAMLYLYKIRDVAREALALAVPAVDRLQAMGHLPSHLFAGHTINAAAQAGEGSYRSGCWSLACAPRRSTKGPRAQL